MRLNAGTVPLGGLVEYAINPDSSRVVYLADQDMDEVDELHSSGLNDFVPFDGPPPDTGTDSLSAVGARLWHRLRWHFDRNLRARTGQIQSGINGDIERLK